MQAPLDPLTPLWRLDALPAGEPVADPDGALWRDGALLTAALQVGHAAEALDLAVAYAKERQQFGKPIGSFQAVKHMCADMLVRAEVARAGRARRGLPGRRARRRRRPRPRRRAARPASSWTGPSAAPSCWPTRPRSGTPGAPFRCTAAWASPGRCRCTCTSSGRASSRPRSAPRPSRRPPWPRTHERDPCHAPSDRSAIHDRPCPHSRRRRAHRPRRARSSTACSCPFSRSRRCTWPTGRRRPVRPSWPASPGWPTRPASSTSACATTPPSRAAWPTPWAPSGTTRPRRSAGWPR